MKQTGHIPYLDYVRILACMLVCVFHAPLPTSDGEGNVWLSIYNYAASPCNALFFMLSGALLFPVNKPLSAYIRHKVVRIAVPVLFWTLVSLLIWRVQGKISWEGILQDLMIMPFDRINGVYWFLYALMGLYLLAPLLSPAFQEKKNMEYFLILWGITLMMPYIDPWLGGRCNVDGSYYRMLSPFGGFLGYMVLGSYLHRYPLSLRRVGRKYYVLVVSIIVGIPASVLLFRFPPVENGTVYGNLVFNVALMAVGYFLLCQKFESLFHTKNSDVVQSSRLTKFHAFVKALASRTFGIYLVHIFVMRDGIWPLWSSLYPHASYAVQIPCVAVLTFAISWALIKLVSFIPGSRYII